MRIQLVSCGREPPLSPVFKDKGRDWPGSWTVVTWYSGLMLLADPGATGHWLTQAPLEAVVFIVDD